MRRSSIRAFVHEPRNATSILVPWTSSTGLRLAGFEGHATCGPMPSTSKAKDFAKVAPSSDEIGRNGMPLWARYRSVVSSAAIIPTFAPISVVMLHSTNRSFIGRASTVGPTNSTAAYWAPSSPVVPITFRITSLAPAEVPDRLMHLRDLRRRRRDPMVQRDHDLRRVPDLRGPDLAEGDQRHREHLVHVQQVDGPIDDLARSNGFVSARLRKDLLRHRERRHRPMYLIPDAAHKAGSASCERIQRRFAEPAR